MGTLRVGATCRITIDNDATTPGTVAIVVQGLLALASATIGRDVFAVAPGSRAQRTLVVPSAQILIIDIYLPPGTTSRASLTVEQDGHVLATRAEARDSRWSLLVE